MKIYIMCPAASYTGGPTLAHQLCSILNANGVTAYMWYFCSFRKRKKINPVHPNYQSFHNPYTLEKPEDTADTLIIALESKTTALKGYKNAKRAIWWMSVDNFYLNMGGIYELVRKRLFRFTPTLEYSKRYENKKKYQIYKEKDIIHYVQSEYARLFLLDKGISPNAIFDLSDYVEDEVIHASCNVDENNKKDIILYNPKKGFEFTKQIIDRNSQYNWVPLIGMTKQQVIEAMKEAKLYIDFGNHPGKDRFPREAVLCGCCIITGKRGAAKNKIDVPIKECYKFDDDKDMLDDISNQISYILNNYKICIRDFDDYRTRTLDEKEKFINEIRELFC